VGDCYSTAVARAVSDPSATPGAVELSKPGHRREIVPDEPLVLDFHRTMARLTLIMVLYYTKEFVHILNDLVEWFDTDDDTVAATEWTQRWGLEAPWLAAWALAQRKAVRAGALLDPACNMAELLFTLPSDITVIAATVHRSNVLGGWLEWLQLDQQPDKAIGAELDTALRPLLANPLESETEFLTRAKALYRAHAAAAAKFGIKREHPNSQIWRER
jgi:hypothetical protein